MNIKFSVVTSFPPYKDSDLRIRLCKQMWILLQHLTLKLPGRLFHLGFPPQNSD